MLTEATTAREMAGLVKPVRALLKQSKKIQAIKLVRERTNSGLKESLEFVNHVQGLPGVRAVKIAELWTEQATAKSITSTPDHKTTLAGPSNDATPEMPSGTGISLVDWYGQYMETHTYSDWERLVEKCLAAKTTEEEL